MPLSRKEREHRFRVGLVLDAAESVFVARGFASAGVDDIARRAELSVGSLYNLFPSKEALFAAVIERRQDEFMAGVTRDVDAVRSPLEKLERIAAFTLAYFDQHEGIFRLYVSATSGFLWAIRPALGERSFQKHQEFLRFVAGICRAGMVRERWPRSDPDSLALVLSGMLNGFVSRWVTSESRASLRERMPEVVELIYRIVGLGPGRRRRDARVRAASGPV